MSPSVVRAQRWIAVVLLLASGLLLAATPGRGSGDASLAAPWRWAAPQDSDVPVPVSCKCPGVPHEGTSEQDGTHYIKGVFVQLDPGFTGNVRASLRVTGASCECGVRPGGGRCRATAKVRVSAAAGTALCLDHSGGFRWNCVPHGECAPRHQCCQRSLSAPGGDAEAVFELLENTLCGSSETAVFPVSRQLVAPDCLVPSDFRIADVRFHWRCESCRPEASSSSSDSDG